MKSIVDQDDITREISKMMDYEFDGVSEFAAPKLSGLPSEYGVGLIVGPSGSGKSTILNDLFCIAPPPEWGENKAIASHFDSAADAQNRLSAVGFNSVPSWLRPFNVLSNGEQFRANLARGLDSGAVFDEFTSVVDRNVAKSCSVAVSRYIKKNKLKNIVFATCHYDVAEWLQPDWTFDTATGFLSVRGLERRPTIELEIIPCTTKAWDMFSKHHYLTGDINKSSRCWLAVWGGVPVGFASALTFPNQHWKNGWREHRTVVLPDFQGMGLGARISDAVAEIFLAGGCRYFSKTAHPRLGEYRNHSEKWRPTSKNMKARTDYKRGNKTKEDGHKMRHASRVCYSHEYTGVKHG